ncbi:hypothetical protein KIPB_002233 [Kipferlia bialata]|uniref:Uncharacterized protein n=1 Tax=Kipferlia bialata TaxID=797122 RepID=A0A9K3CQ98_9EUKA|nr:hypothetical protein KIPB_002233 [Kipferlia bialata]|eukprot:g2233.t1
MDTGTVPQMDNHGTASDIQLGGSAAVAEPLPEGGDSSKPQPFRITVDNYTYSGATLEAVVSETSVAAP